MSTKAEGLASKFGANLSGIINLKPGAEGQGQGRPPVSPPPVDPYGGAIKSKKYGELPIDQIDRDPEQPREEFDEADLQTLAQSIRRKGQLQPIRVTPGAEAGRWVVLVGERRWRACKLAGLASIEVKFVEGPITEADRAEEQLMENIARCDLKPAEQGKGYRRLMSLRSWTVKDLIAELEVEPTSVHRALGLARLPDDVAALVDAGKIKPTAGYEISKLEDPDDVRELARAAAENRLDHKGVVEAVARRKKPAAEPKAKAEGRGAKSPAKPQRPTFEVFRAGAAKVTVEFRKAVDPRAVLVALEEAANRQRERVGAIEGDDRDAA